MTIFVKAYQAYSSKNYDQCLKLLQEIRQNDVRKLDLQAQVYFQKKDYQKAYDTYQEILDGKKDEFTDERRENVLTIIACAQLEQPGTLKTKPRDKLSGTSDIVEQVQKINLKDDTVFDMFAKKKSCNKNKKNKKRKQKLPKSYNPDVPPDPERWLPMRDRKSAAHRHKQKRRQRPNPKGKSRGR